MRRLLANFIDWVVEAPWWVRNVVALALAAGGVGLFVLCGRHGIHEGGKFAAILIGVGLMLFAADLFIE